MSVVRGNRTPVSRKDIGSSGRPAPWRGSPALKHVVQEDLSGGLELYPIRVWNTVNKETVPPFEYIKTIETFPNYKRTPLICECVDACDSSCVCMGYPYSDQFPELAYNEATGRLKRFPEKWNHSHRVLWECSDSCPCGSECPSRSAQLGLRFQMEVFMTAKKGWGVRALREIPKGSFVAEYAGVMTNAKEDEVFSENNWYSFDIMSELGATNFYIDATTKGNVARFFNHGCNPNMMAFHVFYDDNNPALGMHICFYSIKDIKEREEMTFDYGSDYWEAKMSKGLGCDCGNTNCLYRTRKRSKKFKKAKVMPPAEVDSPAYHTAAF